MKILALDCSGLVAGVALVEDDDVIAEYMVNYKITHCQSLLPMLDEIVKMIDLDLHTIDAVAVAGGPGSFTGLRIGSATAKGLCLALDKPIIQIPTVDGLAYNLCGARDMVCPLMDARRDQVYTGLYEFDGTQMRVLLEQCAVPIDGILGEINRRNRPVVFSGDGVPVFRGVIREKCKTAHTFAPAHMNRQRAAAVGALAMEYAKAGKFQTAAEHRPEYLRLSQAERELKERQNGI